MEKIVCSRDEVIKLVQEYYNSNRRVRGPEYMAIYYPEEKRHVVLFDSNMIDPPEYVGDMESIYADVHEYNGFVIASSYKGGGKRGAGDMIEQTIKHENIQLLKNDHKKSELIKHVEYYINDHIKCIDHEIHLKRTTGTYGE